MSNRRSIGGLQAFLSSSLILVASLLALVATSSVNAFKDPHNVFCGEDECYAVLGLQQGASKAEIKKAYRTISLDVHPDKNPSPAARERFTKVAKAHTVLTDEELSKKYHFFLEHPDAYWLEYGHSWVMQYAKATDVRVVLLGLLALVSFLAYGIQYTRYTTAVKYLQKAAERNFGPKQGGNAATMQLRRDAEALLAERKGATMGKKNGADMKGSKAKQSRKEKEAELASVIEELALKVDIKGSCHKPTWEDQPLVILARLPKNIATYLLHTTRFAVTGLFKKEVHRSEREYWARRTVGGHTWDDLDDEARNAALDGDAWRGGKEMEEWKQDYLNSGGGATRKMISKGLRRRTSSGRGNRGMAGGDLMTGVVAKGSAVDN